MSSTPRASWARFTDSRPLLAMQLPNYTALRSLEWVWPCHRPTNNRRILNTWYFLHPFFVFHGYNPYVHKDPKAFCSPLISSTKRSTVDVPFPFAQYCCQDESQIESDFIVSVIPSLKMRRQLMSPRQLSVACAQQELAGRGDQVRNWWMLPGVDFLWTWNHAGQFMARVLQMSCWRSVCYILMPSVAIRGYSHYWIYSWTDFCRHA